MSRELPRKWELFVRCFEGRAQYEKKGVKLTPKGQQKEPSAEVELLRRVKRLEGICLILCIAVVLLGFSGVRLAGTAGKISGRFKAVTEQLNFIGQQVDALRQGVQGFQ